MACERDLIVVGGGPGGMAAAWAAARAGLRPLLVQLGPIGGECTFSGCVPSKTVIEAAARAASFGEAMGEARRVVANLAGGEDDQVFHREGVDVLHGWATFRSPHAIEVDGTGFQVAPLRHRHGSQPSVPTVDGLADVDVLTNENVFELADRPASLAVLGGGAVGCELAQAFRRLGADVTVIEAHDRLLAREEPEASAAVAEQFAAEGIRLRLGLAGEAGRTAGGQAGRLLRPGQRRHRQRRPAAAGSRPAGRHRRARSRRRRGGHRRRLHPGRRPAGDHHPGNLGGGRCDRPAPPHPRRRRDGPRRRRQRLSRRGRRRFDPSAIPWVTFTDPEVARVGMTEAEEAAAHGGRVAFLPMAAVDRAVAASRTRGFVKLLAGPRRLLGNAGGGRILGATIVAERGGELIHEAALAMRTGMFAGRLAQTVHAYPTWSMAVRQAAAQFFMEIDGRRARPAVGGSSRYNRQRS